MKNVNIKITNPAHAKEFLLRLIFSEFRTLRTRSSSRERLASIALINVWSLARQHCYKADGVGRPAASDEDRPRTI